MHHYLRYFCILNDHFFLYDWDVSSTANSHRLSVGVLVVLEWILRVRASESSSKLLRYEGDYIFRLSILPFWLPLTNGCHFILFVKNIIAYFSSFFQQFNTLLVCSMRYLNCSVLKRKLLPFLKRYRVAPSCTPSTQSHGVGAECQLESPETESMTDFISLSSGLGVCSMRGV